MVFERDGAGGAALAGLHNISIKSGGSKDYFNEGLHVGPVNIEKVDPLV